VITNGDEVTARARLWKNGEKETLTDESSNSCANSVFVSGKDVYVAGYSRYLIGNSDVPVAKLWKNGKAQKLTNGTKNAEAFSVCVSGNDVYVAGYVKVIEELEPGSGGLPYSIGYFKATLWKNGKKLDLKVGKADSQAISVFVK